MSDASQLISGYFDGSLTDEEVEQLDSLLQTDKTQASVFARFAILHSAIRDTVDIERSLIDLPDAIAHNNVDPASGPADPGSTLLGLAADIPEETAADAIPAPIPLPIKKTRRKPPEGFGRRTALAAAILLVSGTALLVLLHSVGILGGPSPEPIAMGRTLDATWSNPEAVPAAGSPITSAVPLSLTSGCAELTSVNGLTVIVQGPAIFAVEASGVVFLTSGRLTANVPKAARGFTVDTPAAHVVDLGTEFGVHVSASGETDVQTFRGTVSLSLTNGATSSPAASLTAGMARHVAISGAVSDLAPDAVAYVRSQQFDDWSATPQAIPYMRWKAYSDRLRADPDLVAYYTFEKSPALPARLMNSANTGASLDGVLAGTDTGEDLPQWTVGRWPEKGAVSFAAGSHQHIDIPAAIGGPLDFSRGDQAAAPFTICAWIRPEDPHPSHTSILLKGAQITAQYAIELFPDSSVHACVGNTAIIGSNSVAPSGSWCCLVLACEPARGAAQFYLNGVLVAASSNVPQQLPETIDALTLGSRKAGRLDFMPPMVGRVDELAVFRRAMSADEVKCMYLAEKLD